MSIIIIFLTEMEWCSYLIFHCESILGYGSNGGVQYYNRESLEVLSVIVAIVLDPCYRPRSSENFGDQGTDHTDAALNLAGEPRK